MMKQLSFNVAVDLTGILGMIFLLFSICFHSALTTAKTRRLSTLMVLFTGEVTADLIACIYYPRPNALFTLHAAFVVKTVLGSAMLLVFVSLLRTSLALRPNQWRGSCRVIFIASGAMLVSMVTNPIHQLYFRFSSPASTSCRGIGFPILSVYFCLVLGTCLHQVLSHREAKWVTRFSLGFYCVTHIIAWLLQPFASLFSLVNIASLVSILVLSSTYYAEQNLRFAQQELELRNARAALVLSQIQPHFLFNSMTAVMDLCDTDPQEAKAALQELSDYLHYKISALSGNFLVQFSEDMDFLRNYLKLEKRRFGARLNVEYDIGAADFQVPLLTLQPLAENAIRHGLSKKPEGGTIRVITREIAEYYSILVEDDGVGFDTAALQDMPGTHVGLNNVRSRLAILCGGSLTVRSTPGAGTTVEITIRKTKEESQYENTRRG